MPIIRNLCRGAAIVSVGLGSVAVSAFANAQTGSVGHKTHVVDSRRVARPELGISYVSPDGYADNAPAHATTITLEGKRTNSQTALADYRSSNYRLTVNGYIETSITVIRQPEKTNPMPPFPFTTQSAKDLLDMLNASHVNGGNPLNYQNSAKIQVAGHDALAILAETSVPDLTDRGMLRLVLLRHSGRLYIFEFQAVDVEFETRVPAFENFMNSVKFLEPDVEPTSDKAAPAGPVSISIGK